MSSYPDRWSLYERVRAKDSTYQSAFKRIAAILEARGCAHLVEAGSTRLKTNLIESDIDIAVGFDPSLLKHVVAVFREQESEWHYVGYRSSSNNFGRHLFRGRMPGVRVDLMLMLTGDAERLAKQFTKARSRLTVSVAREITWSKFEFFRRRDWEGYVDSKVAFYAEYFPEMTLNRAQMIDDLIQVHSQKKSSHGRRR